MASLSRDSVLSALRREVARRSGIEEADLLPDERIVDFGIDSAMAVDISDVLSGQFKRYFDPTLFFSEGTLAKVAEAYVHPAAGAKASSESKRTSQEPIAIVGIGCRFPGAHGPDAYWNLLNGDHDAIADPTSVAGHRNLRHRAGLIANPFRFDAEAFSLRPVEAEAMDPQQRWLLETAWEAIDDAGMRQEDLKGRKVGVFVGVSGSDYRARVMGEDMTVAAVTGNSAAITVNRLSYVFDWRGPSVAIDTACSSSLSALNLAVRALRAGECEIALVGGVNGLFDDDITDALAAGGMLADDGRCKTFDASADGYVRAEGCGLVVLRRESVARQRGDRIYATVAGVAWNQDGRTNGLTAPNPAAQVAVIGDSLADAGLNPEQVDYVEAHGTGTLLGDPIEVRAISDALGAPTRRPVLVGSAKTHVGHLEAAAGIAGLIKLSLAIHFGHIPPSLNFKKPNPHIPFSALNIEVLTKPTPWPNPEQIAGVSSFGFGGGNAHAILKAPARITDEAAELAPLAVPMIMPLYAHSAENIPVQAERWADWIEQHPSIALDDVVATAAHRRSTLSHQAAIVAVSPEEAVKRLRELSQSSRRSARVTQKPRVLFVFSGQGSQYPGMGEEWDRLPAAGRAVLRRCDRIAREEFGWSVIEELTAPADRSRLAATEYAQPCLFAWQSALAASWRAWGVAPEAVIGHSVGEFAAAYLAGVLTCEDAFRLTVARGAAMAELHGTGGMLAVELTRDEALAQILAGQEEICIAAENGPRALVLSGSLAALDSVKETVGELERLSRWTSRAYPFHSPHCVSAGKIVADAATAMTHSGAALAWYSTVTGEPVDGHGISPAYWADNACNTVLFDAAVTRAHADGVTHVVEFGGQSVLRSHLQRLSSEAAEELRVYSADGDGHTGRLRALSRWFEDGGKLNFNSLVAPRRLRCAGPLYPWADTHFIARPREVEGKRQRDRFVCETTPLPPDEKIRIFSATIDPEREDWLCDHVIRGRPVFPASGFLEMLFETAQLIAAPPWVFRKVVFLKPLYLDDEPVQLTVAARQEEGGEISISIYRRPAEADGNEWSILCRAQLFEEAVSQESTPMDRSPNPPDGVEIDTGALYEQLYHCGYEYREHFKGINKIYDNEGVVTGNLRAAVGKWISDPRVLDAALQCTSLLGSKEYGSALYLPHRMECIKFEESPLNDVSAVATLLEMQSSVQLRADIGIISQGRNCVSIEGASFTRMADQISDHSGNWLYEDAWRSSPGPAVEAVEPIFIGWPVEERELPKSTVGFATIDAETISQMRALEAQTSASISVIDARWLNLEQTQPDAEKLAQAFASVTSAIRLLAETPFSLQVSYLIAVRQHDSSAFSGLLRTSNVECPTLFVKIVIVPNAQAALVAEIVREGGIADD